MIKYKTTKVISVQDWDALVRETFGRPYRFQQQDGCKERQRVHIETPSEFTEDNEMNDEIPEIVNGEVMGIKFEKWLERDPSQPIVNQAYNWQLGLFWERNFYPDIYTIANDLHSKGLIDAGEYEIDIDW